MPTRSSLTPRDLGLGLLVLDPTNIRPIPKKIRSKVMGIMVSEIIQEKLGRVGECG